MKSFEDYIIVHPNVIDSDFCDKIIEKFESDDRCIDGQVSGGNDTNMKISLDLNITPHSDWGDIDSQLGDSLMPYFNEYSNFIEEHTHKTTGKFLRHDSGYQIQKTSPGGLYNWHDDSFIAAIPDAYYTDNVGTTQSWMAERIYTFILYLNDRGDDVENGRTQFYNSGISKSIVPKAGKLLLFPASPFWVHRGEPLTSGVKYLITGWVSFARSSRLTELHSDQMEVIRGICE